MLDKKIQLNITTPEQNIFSKEVSQVTIPTTEGEITVLVGHLPLVSVLRSGELRFIYKGKEESLAVSGGFLEVLPNKVTILADTAEIAEDIDLEKAEEAKKRAEKLLEEKRDDTEEFALIAAKLEKEFARVKVARKRKYRK